MLSCLLKNGRKSTFNSFMHMNPIRFKHYHIALRNFSNIKSVTSPEKMGGVKLQGSTWLSKKNRLYFSVHTIIFFIYVTSISKCGFSVSVSLETSDEVVNNLNHSLLQLQNEC